MDEGEHGTLKRRHGEDGVVDGSKVVAELIEITAKNQTAHGMRYEIEGGHAEFRLKVLYIVIETHSIDDTGLAPVVSEKKDGLSRFVLDACNEIGIRDSRDVIAFDNRFRLNV